MSISAAILSRVKGFCSARGINVKDEFRYIDRKKTGFITDQIFRRFFVNIGFAINDQQFTTLVDEFKVEDDLIDVFKFIGAVESAGNYSNLQKTDTKPILSELSMLRGYLATNNTTLRELFRPYDSNCRGYVNENAFFRELGNSNGIRKIARAYTLDPSLGVFYSQIEKDIADLPDFSVTRQKPDLTNIASAVMFQGVDVASTFRQYDRFRTGRLTPENFATVIRDICPHDVNKLIDYYQDCDGLCDTKRFCRDVMNQTQTLKAIPKKEKEPPQPPNPDEVMKFFKNAINQRRVRIQDAFPSDAKSVSYSVFYNIVESLGLGLTPEDIDVVANRYKVNRDIDLVSFFQYFAPGQPKIAAAPVKEIRDFLTRTHQTLLPLCQRTDPKNTGDIDAFQLHSVMNRVGFALNREDLDAIVRDFRGKGPATVRYVDFCRAVDPKLEYVDSQKLYFQQEAERERREKEAARQRRVPFQPGIIPILQKINYAAERRLVMVYDEIKEIDRLRCGFINEQQLYDALSFVALTPQERQQLWAAYPDGRYCFLIEDLRDPRAQPERTEKRDINEHLADVLSELKGVLNTRSLSIYDVIGERNSLATRAAAQLSRYTSEASLVVDSFRNRKRPEFVDSIALFMALESVPMRKKAIYRDNVNAVYLDLVTIRQKLIARHVQPQSLFRGCAKMISFQEFVDRLESANIIIDGRESERLQRKFDSPQRVDWSTFLSELENSTTLAPVE